MPKVKFTKPFKFSPNGIDVVQYEARAVEDVSDVCADIACDHGFAQLVKPGAKGSAARSAAGNEKSTGENPTGENPTDTVVNDEGRDTSASGTDGELGTEEA